MTHKGRVAGTPNRKSTFLLKRLQAMYGEDFHPIMKMAGIASDDDNDIRLRFDAWKEIAKYTEAQLKAVEITGEDGGPITISNVNRTIVNNTDS